MREVRKTHAVTYFDIEWTYAGVACTDIGQISELEKCCQDCPDVNHSSCSMAVAVRHSSIRPPTSSMSPYVTSYPMLVLQVTNDGVRESGYKQNRK